MTPIATPDDNSLHASAHPASARPSPAKDSARTLSEAIQAVNEHRRQVELRRMEHAARQSAQTSDWTVPVPRAQLEAIEQQAREASALRGLLDHGPVIAVPFSTLAPHTLRDMPLSLSRAIGHVHDAGVRDRRLTRLFVAADGPRLQQALYDSDAATLIASLRRIDGRALRCTVHLTPVDASDPDWRWACIVRLPQAAIAAQAHATARHLLPKPNQRPRLDAQPAQSV